MIADIEGAVEALQSGGVVLIPTDTVYGLAALASDDDAVARLYELKQRPAGVPIALLVASSGQAETVGVFGSRERAVADQLWPGPITMVVPATDDRSYAAEDGTVGVRCPGNELVRKIAAITGPLATTSANRHGAVTPVDVGAVVADLAGKLDVVIDKGPCPGLPSTVVTIGPPIVVHREGTITQARISRCLTNFDK